MEEKRDTSTLPRSDQGYLQGLSDLAVRGFRTTNEAFQAILALVTDQLHFRTSFLTQITPELNRNHILHSHNEPGGCDMPSGVDLPLDKTFCSLVVTANGTAPAHIEDTRSELYLLQHPRLESPANVASYIGVPIILHDGSVFGTLCAIDPEPHVLTSAQTELLVVLARLVALQLEHDRELAARLEVEARLQQHAWYDGLTLLPNRVLLAERLQQALAGVHRGDGRSFVVLFLDLDRFKPVNDSLGHPAGDAMLIEAGHRLRSCVRGTDTVARWGGDEFVILLADMPDLVRATHVAERVQDALSEPFVLGEHSVVTSASIGIVIGTPRYQSPTEVLRDADIAMYRAKSQGKAQFAIFDQDMHTETLSKLWLEGDMRRAIEREELVLYYQPVVDMVVGNVVRLEALVRWQHPSRGIVPPAEFLALAEEIGYIGRLDAWVLRAACAQYRSWGDAGLEPVPIAINVSCRTVTMPDFVALVRSTLEEFCVDARHLVIEMTEHALTQALDEAAGVLQSLRELGVQVWLDNFGAGPSTLAQVVMLPLDGIKIDRSFVQELPTSPRLRAVTTALIAMADHLGLALIVEGVETSVQRDVLRAHGCQLGQGYLLGRPAPAGEHLPFSSLHIG